MLISIAFRKQLKQNFSQIIEHLPGEVIAKDYTLSNITESINRYKENKELEILLLKDRENYRKEFFGNVAHELKTPLFSMQGFLLTLIEGGMNDESIRYRYLDRINSSLERLIFIIKDLDLLSELENRNLKLNIKNFNLTALTREIIDILEYKAKKNKIKVDFTSGSNKDVFAIGDVERIGQVLTNLIANGISYAGEDATISVSFQNNANKIMVSIKDNGIGIKPEHLERLFERFYRVDEHRSRSQGGSGLGLSIVKNILHAHKENITVRSTYGYGTEFIFSLQKA
ncbi:MAG: ATP-binding protein [Flavobacteriales bacterium]|nr:ATP-binding protein [Flavobacteriales bacterium]